MSGTGNRCDNAAVETVFKTIKAELLRRTRLVRHDHGVESPCQGESSSLPVRITGTAGTQGDGTEQGARSAHETATEAVSRDSDSSIKRSSRASMSA